MEEVGYEPVLKDHVGASPAVERRLTLRLLAYWERIRGNRPMPAESDINPDDSINDMWDDCFLMHVKDLEQDDYNFIYLGENIKAAFVGSTDNDPACSWKSLNVKRLSPHIEQVMQTKAPFIHEGEARNDMNQLVKFRQCLLPIGEGDKVLAIFGGMRCKIYP